MADPASFIASWLTPSSLFIFINLVICTIAIASRFGAPPKNQHQHQHQHHQPQRVRSFNLDHYNTTHDESEYNQPQLVRTPSLLERVTSFNLSLRKQDVDVQPEPENPELVRTPSILERVTSFNLSLQKHAETQHVHPEPEPEPESEPDPEPEPEPEQPALVRTPSLLQRIQSINFSRLYRSDSTHREDPDPDSDSAGPGKAEMRKSASERWGSMDGEWEEEEELEKRRPQTARVEKTSWRGDEEVDAKADDFINSFKKQLRLQRIDSLLRTEEEVTRE